MSTTLVDGFEGILGQGISITITPPGSGAVAIPLHVILDWQPMTREYKTTTYIPQSGTLAGKEQAKVGSEKASPASATVVYEKLHMAAFDSVAGINDCVVVFTWPDGKTATGTGNLNKIETPKNQDTQTIQSTLNFLLNAGWVWGGGASGSGT